MAVYRLARGERLLSLRAAEGLDGYEVHTLDAQGLKRSVLADLPPRSHVDLLPQEHGEIRVSMLVERLLRRLRTQKKQEPRPTHADRPRL
ncbi:MAG TPA: hypothetical protein VGR28_01350 [Candidatus Thermoplasmatota archaeon]|jgi:hypothetical protein|nr:hypothetical protein [Candidatus Thermoplasmatota archaeon]